MPTLRKLIADGVAADAMTPVNPTVTWPNHTSLVTGVDAAHHQVLFNGLLTFPSSGAEPLVKPWINKDELVHAKTLYELASDHGLTTAQVDWVAIYGARGLNWSFPERPDPDGPIERDLVDEKFVTREELENFGEDSSPAWHDQVWTDAAVDIVKRHTPNLLLFHLLATDSLQHRYGALTPAAYEAYAYADTRIAALLQAFRDAKALDRTTFFIVSDHGFASFSHTVSPNVVLMQDHLMHVENGQYAGDVWAKAEGGTAMIYIRKPEQRAELIPKLTSEFAALEGVEHVYEGKELEALGLPTSDQTDQAPQLVLSAKSGYSFLAQTQGNVIQNGAIRGTHGYVNTNPDMQALFVASGAAIRQGVPLGTISNLQVAPTIAMILGLKLDAAQGEPLKSILK